jgi:molybdopterin-containing oxidoreductase family membrane subunit
MITEGNQAVASRPPVIRGDHNYASITDKLTSVIHGPTPGAWWTVFGSALLLLGVLVVSIGWLLYKGVGIWGIRYPVMWGFAITNFVWWIGIGHAGTFISAVLLLLNQRWRNSINNSAEAMTIFAVACAGLFPLLHLGRPWFFYWMLPYPNTMSVQPQFRSPLVFDVFAITTYATVSLLFWYLGLLPDLATFRNSVRSRHARLFYGIISLGWRGSSQQWRMYRSASLLLAGLATPLVLSVHTIVSFDFTISIVPGWHSTIFPPYFVAGAIYSGFAMVLILLIPLRRQFHLYDIITERHLDNSAKLLLATGLIVAYAYLIEPFYAWYSGSEYEMYAYWSRMFGEHSRVSFWITILCNVVVPQSLWLARVRRKPSMLFAVSLFVLLGMWLERYVIVINSLERGYIPSSWTEFHATFWDFATLFGSMGLFFVLFLLFVRFLPMISIFEVRELLQEGKGGKS